MLVFSLFGLQPVVRSVFSSGGWPTAMIEFMHAILKNLVRVAPWYQALKSSDMLGLVPLPGTGGESCFPAAAWRQSTQPRPWWRSGTGLRSLTGLLTTRRTQATFRSQTESTWGPARGQSEEAVSRGGQGGITYPTAIELIGRCCWWRHSTSRSCSLPG